MKKPQVETALGLLLNDPTRRPQEERQEIFDSLVQRLGRYLRAFDRRYLMNCATGFNGVRVPQRVNQRISNLLKGSRQLEPRIWNTKAVWNNVEYFIKQR